MAGSKAIKAKSGAAGADDARVGSSVALQRTNAADAFDSPSAL